MVNCVVGKPNIDGGRSEECVRPVGSVATHTNVVYRNDEREFDITILTSFISNSTP